MKSNKREIEQNPHQETRNMDEQHTPETAMNFVLYLIYLMVSSYISWFILCIGIIIISCIY